MHWFWWDWSHLKTLWKSFNLFFYFFFDTVEEEIFRLQGHCGFHAPHCMTPIQKHTSCEYQWHQWMDGRSVGGLVRRPNGRSMGVLDGGTKGRMDGRVVNLKRPQLSRCRITHKSWWETEIPGNPLWTLSSWEGCQKSIQPQKNGLPWALINWVSRTGGDPTAKITAASSFFFFLSLFLWRWIHFHRASVIPWPRHCGRK